MIKISLNVTCRWINANNSFKEHFMSMKQLEYSHMWRRFQDSGNMKPQSLMNEFKSIHTKSELN